jgi:4-methylaminobutanoate oxidase (formaldehyde-forming)
LITETIAGVTADLPVLEDPSVHAYYREETGGLMVGMFEPDCAPWKVEASPRISPSANCRRTRNA